MKFVTFFLAPAMASHLNNFLDIYLGLLTKRIHIRVIVLSGLIFTACYKKDDSSVEIESATQISFELIGADLESVYQYNYDGSLDIGAELNLTLEIGVPVEFLTIRQVGNTVSFYSFEAGRFSLFQKNILTQATNSYPEFYENTSERSIVWGTNNEEAVFFGFYGPQGTTNLAVHRLTLNNLEGADLSLQLNINMLYQPLYEDDRLFITYRDSDLQYKIAIYDTNSGLLMQTLEYGSASPSLLIDENGNLAVFKFSPDNGTNLEIYNLNTLTMIEEIPLTFGQRLLPGPITGVLKNGKLYYEFEYQQPFLIAKGPAVFDIASGDNTVVDLLSIVNKLETDEEILTRLISCQYDADEGVFLVSYSKLNTTQNLEGGIMVISENGLLLNNVEVPFAPIYLVK